MVGVQILIFQAYLQWGDLHTHMSCSHTCSLTIFGFALLWPCQVCFKRKPEEKHKFGGSPHRQIHIICPGQPDWAAFRRPLKVKEFQSKDLKSLHFEFQSALQEDNKYKVKELKAWFLDESVDFLECWFKGTSKPEKVMIL